MSDAFKITCPRCKKVFDAGSAFNAHIESTKKEEAKKQEEEKRLEKERLQEEERLAKEEKAVASEPSGGGSLTGNIARLQKLYKSGTLTKAEFEKAKNNLLK